VVSSAPSMPVDYKHYIMNWVSVKKLFYPQLCEWVLFKEMDYFFLRLLMEKFLGFSIDIVVKPGLKCDAQFFLSICSTCC
jgi:hypothetical protein